MYASLRALLVGIIDYAGLFPPAQLPLEQAIQNDTSYRNSPDTWMLGRFICPAARLKELTKFPPLSVVGRGGATAKDFFTGMANDQEDMLALRRHRPEAVIGAYEVRLSNELLHADHSKDLHHVISSNGSHASFFEVEYSPHWREGIERLASVLKTDSKANNGIKVRCGGVIAAAVPSTDDLAFALVTCRKDRVPLKFTAGLHHPIRRHDTTLNTKIHGFLNVFAAGILGRFRELNVEQVRNIIEEENAAHFHFDDNGLRWKDLHATTDEIAQARKETVLSFGSCSFDEPREDLRELGWL